MFILLPPSEGKTAPREGATLDLDSLSYPELSAARREIITDLIRASAAGPEAIGAPPSTKEQVEANTRLWGLPTSAASSVYTGVLFAAAGLDRLDEVGAARARDHVRIASTVFGLLAPDDEIPAYRLPPSARLANVGAPISHLAPAVSRVMEAQRPSLVLDCRSGPYIRLWRPTCPWVHVRAVEIRGGEPVVVSHFAKHHRGILTHHLLNRQGPLPTSVEGVRDAARELLGAQYQRVELIEGKPGTHVLELTLPAG